MEAMEDPLPCVLLEKAGKVAGEDFSSGLQKRCGPLALGCRKWGFCWEAKFMFCGNSENVEFFQKKAGNLAEEILVGFVFISAYDVIFTILIECCFQKRFFFPTR